MKLKKATAWIIKNPMEIIAAVCLTVSVFLTAFNAFTRYIFRYTWNPSIDIVQLCFGYTVFCGSAAAYKRKMHMGIDLITSRLPKKAKAIVGLISHIILTFALGFSTYLAFDLMQHVGGKVLTTTKISYKWFDLAAVLGFAFMEIYEIQQFIDDAKKFFVKKEGTEE